MSTIREELLSIQAHSSDGLLYPGQVVNWAKDNPDSAIHSSLEWDDQAAAHQHRLQQVRRLIEVHVSFQAYQPVVVSLSIDRSQGGGYRSLSDVLEAPDLLTVLRRDALSELERVRQKYERILGLAGIWSAIDEARNSIGGGSSGGGSGGAGGGGQKKPPRPRGGQPPIPPPSRGRQPRPRPDTIA